LILSNYRFLVFNNNFYKKEFSKLNVYQNFSSEEFVNLESEKLINYFCCGKVLNRDFFTTREIVHLADVKNLIILANFQLILFLIVLAAITLYLLFKKQQKMLIKRYQFASQATLIAIGLSWFSSKLNFNFFFINFHYLAFQNDYWQLPESSNLIKLFPEQFFADFANRVALQTAIIASVIFIFTYLNLNKYATKKY